MTKLVCLGDSLTEGYGVDKELAWPALLQEKLHIEVINCGISGDTTAGMLARFYPQVLQFNPSHVIIMGGTNDIWWNVNQNIIQANIQAMTRQAEHNGMVPVIGLPIPIYPEGVDEAWGPKSGFSRCQKKVAQYVKSLKAQAKADQFLYLDFYSLFVNNEGEIIEKYFLDGIHPTEEGHRLMAELAAEKLKSLF